MQQAVNATGQKYSHMIAEGLWTVTIHMFDHHWESDSFNNPTVGALMDALDQWIGETGDSHIFLEHYKVSGNTITLELGS